MNSNLTYIENESQIKQSLELFKNWLSKHSFIKFTGDGEHEEG